MLYGGEAAPATETTPDPRLDDPTEAVDHMVCCRGSWDVALCGADVSEAYISFVPDRICPLCVEAWLRRLAAFKDKIPEGVSPPRCWQDGSLCPPDEEIDRRIDDFLSS